MASLGAGGAHIELFAMHAVGQGRQGSADLFGRSAARIHGRGIAVDIQLEPRTYQTGPRYTRYHLATCGRLAPGVLSTAISSRLGAAPIDRESWAAACCRFPPSQQVAKRYAQFAFLSACEQTPRIAVRVTFHTGGELTSCRRRQSASALHA